MPLDPIPASIALDKSQFHKQLRRWLSETDEDVVGPDGYGQRGLIHVRSGRSLFKLNADTTRSGVKAYLELVDRVGDNLNWEVTTSQRGNMTAVIYGREGVRIPGFFLYFLRDDR